jgi:heme A synthase
MALALAVVAASGVAARHRSQGGSLSPSMTGHFPRLAIAATATVYVILVGGVLVSRPGALMRCLNWPGIVGLGQPDDLFGWLYLLRFGLGVLASAMIAALVIQAWKTQRERPKLVRDATLAGVLVVVAVAVGALVPTPDAGVFMPALSMALAAALWAVLVAVVMRAGRRID